MWTPRRPSASCFRSYVAACEQPDLAGLASLIREDAVMRMPPQPEIWVGRDAIFRLMVDAGFGTEEFGRLRCVTTRANRQPAVACYVLGTSDTTYRAMAVDVLRIEEGMISEIVTFGPEVFGVLGLPITLESQQGPERDGDLRGCSKSWPCKLHAH